jgi:hypothetical protein
MAEQGL